jgi:hypothetical protein
MQVTAMTCPAVRMRGLEPPRGFPHGDLNAARLPIPPHPRAADESSARRKPVYGFLLAFGECVRKAVSQYGALMPKPVVSSWKW